MSTLQLVESSQDPLIVSNKHELDLHEQANTHRLAWFREWRLTVGALLSGTAVLVLYVTGHGAMAERILGLLGCVLLGTALKPKPPAQS